MDEEEDLFDEMPSQGFYTSVEELGIKYKYKKELSDKDYKILANQLKFADIIQINKLWIDYLDLVSAVLEKSVLSEIQLKDIKVTSGIMNTISKILNNNPTIFHLRFEGEHKTLSNVILIENSLNSDHICALIEGIKVSQSIKMLEIQENFVGAKGLKAIAEYLSLTTKLERLQIAEFDSEKDGLFQLSKGLKSNYSLTVLSLSTSNQDKKDASWIFKALRYNCVLQTLSVSFNDAFETKELDKEILALIRKNRGLHSFNISDFENHSKMIKAIKENLGYNSYLTDISLDHQADEELEELLDKNIMNQTEQAKKFLVCCRTVVLLPLPHELKRHVFDMLCKACLIPFASISPLADTFLDKQSIGFFDSTMWFSEHALSSQCYSYLSSK
ncbi:hypothetical protein HDV06_002931 [Boothiomyces sp. JEL0866]|nr:hypothetical protein HDV06_002931 [Boothiomyces sp. JEL0866]